MFPKNGTVKNIKMLFSLFGIVKLYIFIPLINLYNTAKHIQKFNITTCSVQDALCWHPSNIVTLSMFIVCITEVLPATGEFVVVSDAFKVDSDWLEQDTYLNNISSNKGTSSPFIVPTFSSKHIPTVRSRFPSYTSM